MSKKIFVAATGQNSGKTTISLSLMHMARKMYRRVGFMKPIGPKPTNFHGLSVDKDAALVAQIHGLEEDIETMSPVVLQHDSTRKALDGEVCPDTIEKKIRTACTEMEKKYDFLVIEGAGHSGVGSVLGMSNAKVAKLLDAPVLMVTGGGVGSVIDAVSMNLALYQAEGTPVRLVLPNKLLLEKRAEVLHYLRRAFQGRAFTVAGGFNYSPILAHPTLHHISRLLDLPLRARKEQASRIIHNVQLGAASAQRVADLLKTSTLLLVTSTRDELLVMLASLYHIPEYREKIAGLIILGVAPVSRITQEILDGSEVPYMRTRKTTAEVFTIIKNDVSKITAEDKEKISLVHSLAESEWDIEAIEALLKE